MMANTNIGFDCSVVLAHRPHLADKVFAAYRQDRATDLIVRDQLLCLADIGSLEFLPLENGAKMPLSFSQLEMEKRHLGIDRSAEKNDEDAPRNNYGSMKGIPASEYPQDFRDYPLADAKNARLIYLTQEQIALRTGGLSPQFLNSRAALALYLSSCWGFSVDSEMAQEMFDRLSADYHERNFQRLVNRGILIPSEPVMPYVKQFAKAVELLGKTPLDWEPHRAQLEALGIKFKLPQESKYKKAPLQELVKEICDRFGMEVKLTDGGESGNKQISTDAEVQAALQGLDPTLDEYIHRQETAKLVTTELPRMLHGRVHPRYNTLVKSGRTSCYGNSKKDKNPAYPSANTQQIDERVREAYIASPGRILCSIDFDFIELVSVGQTCLELFGHSVLADRINGGYDPHAFLGSRIARKLSGGEFKGSDDTEENYQLFLALKKTLRPLYDHFRGMAKPTGLGFPGGLGAATFIGYAKTTFGVDIVKLAGSEAAALQLAKDLREEWLATYPEMREFFDYVNYRCIDQQWSLPEDKRYFYQSPNGMIRRNCFYTEATNGMSMQTRTAEGAKIALWRLAEEMYDATLGSCLLGSAQTAFIHDEVILDLPYDSQTHERAYRAADLMVAGMRGVMTKVKVGAKPTLMHRWNKKAEPRFDKNNRLIPWTP